MINKHILPKGDSFIKTYPKDANALSILSNYEETYGWLMNSFIQLTSYDNQYLDYYDFYYRICPIIECQRVKIESVYKLYGDIKTFILESLDNGYYPYLLINKKYISAYKCNLDQSHDLFIYGYDKENEIFYISDNFLYGIYSESTCKFYELEAAVQKVPQDDYYSNEFRNCIELLSYTPTKDNRTCFEPYRILASIEDYLDSKATKMWYVNHAMWDRNEIQMRTFGIDCYGTIRKHIAIAEQYGELGPGSIQAFHLIWEHKSTMLKRLQYMKERGIYLEDSIFNKYSYIENLAKNSLMLILKFDASKNYAILSKISSIYKEIENNEKLVLEEIKNTLLGNIGY